MSDVTESVDAPATPPQVPGPSADASPVEAPNILRFELAVVLVLGVLSPLASTVPMFLWPAAYAATRETSFAVQTFGTLHWVVTDSVVMLYIIRRSDRPWSFFGIVPFRWYRDLPWALAVWLGVWFFCDMARLQWEYRLGGPLGRVPESYFAVPATRLDYVLLVLFCAANGFAEEIIFRGYLVPRGEQMLGSAAKAVAVSSLLFASCHIYQGIDSALYLLVWGAGYGLMFAWLRRIWPVAIAHALADFYAMHIPATGSLP